MSLIQDTVGSGSAQQDTRIPMILVQSLADESDTPAGYISGEKVTKALSFFPNDDNLGDLGVMWDGANNRLVAVRDTWFYSHATNRVIYRDWDVANSAGEYDEIQFQFELFDSGGGSKGTNSFVVDPIHRHWDIAGEGDRNQILFGAQQGYHTMNSGDYLELIFTRYVSPEYSGTATFNATCRITLINPNTVKI